MIVSAHLDNATSCPVGVLLHGLSIHFKELISDFEPTVSLSKAPLFDAADVDSNIPTTTALATADGNAKTFSLGLEKVDTLDLGLGHRTLGPVWMIVRRSD